MVEEEGPEDVKAPPRLLAPGRQPQKRLHPGELDGPEPKHPLRGPEAEEGGEAAFGLERLVRAQGQESGGRPDGSDQEDGGSGEIPGLATPTTCRATP